MLQPNRKSTMPTIDLYDPWYSRSSRKWLSLPLITMSLVVVALIIAMSEAAGFALAYSDTPVGLSGGSGTESATLSLTSAADDGQPPSAPSDFLDDVTIWSATMTARVFPQAPSFTGYSSHQSAGDLDTAVFVADGQAHTVNVVALSPLGNALGIMVTPDLEPADTSRWILLVDGLEFAFEDASITPNYEDNETLVVWDDSGLTWKDGQQVSLRLIEWEFGTCPVGEDDTTGVLGATDAQ